MDSLEESLRVNEANRAAVERRLELMHRLVEKAAQDHTSVLPVKLWLCD